MAKRIQNLQRAATSPAMRQALDLGARRWAFRIVWELRSGPLNFRKLQAACGGVSPSVLQRRLHELRDLDLVSNTPGVGYRLTADGEKLFMVLAQLDRWAGSLDRNAWQKED